MIQVFFKTYGCQANVADSEGLATYMAGLGVKKVEAEAEADLIMVNTCAVRDKAEQKMFSYLGELIEYKKVKPYLKIGVIGCVASYRKQEIYDRFDHINFVYGAREDMRTFQAYLADVLVSLETIKQLYEENSGSPENWPAIRSLGEGWGGQDRDIKALVQQKGELPASPFQEEVFKASVAIKEEQKEALKAYVNIMSGCNNYCSFCIVPFTRGRENSYTIGSIIERVKLEVMRGAKEIMLIGQNVNSYHDPETNAPFSALLKAVAEVEGDFWVRYVSPHPKDMTNDVLEAMAAYHTKLCGWIHFPLQSGSTRILESMNRTYTVEKYLDQIAQIRAILPHATITTDIIVGFPGEEEIDYQETRSVMEVVKYDQIYSFIYSPRKYTKAFKLGDPILYEEKQKRLEALQKRQLEICLERYRLWIGKSERVLVEREIEPGLLLARSEGNHRVMVQGDKSLINNFVWVEIYDAGPADLRGRLESVPLHDKVVVNTATSR